MKSLKLRTLKKKFWLFQEFLLMYHLKRDLSMSLNTHVNIGLWRFLYQFEKM